MRSLAPLVALFVALVCAGVSSAASTHAIAQEVARTAQEGKRVVSVWWLPVEYWEAAAREIGWKDERVREVRERLALYSVIGIVDATLTPEKRFAFAESSQLAEKLELWLGGEPVAPVRKLDPQLLEPMPELTYLLRASLAGLASGLRLMFFPNVDGQGKPQVAGGGNGAVRLRYAASEQAPLEFYWHAPLTAVAGGRRDPETGEPIEASWRFNPWTGKKLQP
jgi:hypothetical protein